MDSEKLLKIKEEIFRMLKENDVDMSIENNHWDGWCLVFEDKHTNERLWIKNNDL